VRRHHDPDGAPDAVGDHRVDRLGDERGRVLHPEIRTGVVSVGPQPLDQPIGLCPRRVEQREGVADRRVAFRQLGEMLR
jgi:hypothetical protein